MHQLLLCVSPMQGPCVNEAISCAGLLDIVHLQKCESSGARRGWVEWGVEVDGGFGRALPCKGVWG